MTLPTHASVITLYGIKNCDTIKKARAWLAEHQIDYCLHDYRSDGLDASLLDPFIDQLGWQALLNTRGTTWRRLDESVRNRIDTRQAATALMLQHPAIIKRPLLVVGKELFLGFKPEQYAQIFTRSK